jgi:hypothetical protein
MVLKCLHLSESLSQYFGMKSQNELGPWNMDSRMHFVDLVEAQDRHTHTGKAMLRTVNCTTYALFFDGGML